MKRLLLLVWIAAVSGWADFRKDVQPVFEQNCTACHGAIRQLGAVRLDTESGLQQAKPQRVLSAIESGSMPPSGKLPPGEMAAVRDWLRSGAEWPAGVVLRTGAAGLGGPDNRMLADSIHAKIAAQPQPAGPMRGYTTRIPATEVSFQMVPVPGGEFLMGTLDTERGHKKDEAPVHAVRIEPFWMSAHEVMWNEYRLFMFATQAGEGAVKDPQVDAVSRPTRPYVEMSFGMGIDGYPAIGMTQHGANKYAEWLSAKTGQFYRLPTEAEWEYACRGGSKTTFPWGDDPSQLNDYAWFADNSDGKYQKVMTKKANVWGLYDMLGNVMEWTLDAYAPYTDAGKPITEPWNKSTKPYPQSVRGGSWADGVSKLRCGSRVASDPSWKQQDPQLPKSIWYHTDAPWLGFRLVRPAKIPSAEEMFHYWNNGVEID